MKPREFWITEERENSVSFAFPHPVEGVVHVIELSAFERLRVQYEERGSAMRETGDLVRSLYVAPPRIDGKVFTWKEVCDEHKKKIEALERQVETIKAECIGYLQLLTSQIDQIEALKARLAEKAK